MDAPQEVLRELSRCCCAAYEDLLINVDDTRQGSELEPLLFNYYIHSIWQRWQEYREECLVSYHFVKDFIYADNWVTVLDAEDESHARNYLNELNFFIT